MIIDSFHRTNSINKGNLGKVQHSPPRAVPKLAESTFMETKKLTHSIKNTNYNNPKHGQDVLNLSYKNLRHFDEIPENL